MGRIQIPDYVIHDIGDIQTLSQEYSWGITDLQVPNTWKVTDGKGVTVAVLDTGCPLNHDDLQTSIDLNKAKSCISDEDIYDLAGHGTHVAGIIAARNNFYGTVGVAPEATIIPVKVLNKSGMSQRSSVEDGLDYCIAIKPDIINMSLGGSAPMPSIKYRIDKLIAMGIPIVCSAGNNGKNQVLYPANYDEVFAIGSYSPGMIRKRSSFSSFGDELDFSAPGQEILSTWLNNQYAVLSGTSMAAPFVAGVLALLLSKYKKDKKNLTVAEIKQLLISSCLEAGREGFDQEFGWGIIYPEKLVATSSNVPPKVKPPRKPSFFDRFKRMFNK